MLPRPARLLLGLAVSWICCAGLYGQDGQKIIHAVVRVANEDPTTPGVDLQIDFRDSSNNPVRKPPPLVLTPGLRHKENYKVIGTKKGGGSESIALKKEPILGREDTAAGTASSVALVLNATSLDAYSKVQVEVGDTALAFPAAYRFEKRDLFAPLEAVAVETEYRKMRTLANKFEIQEGSAPGAFSARATYRWNNPFGSADWFHIEALGKADIDFRSKEKTRYFNSIVFQLSGFYIGEFPRRPVEQKRDLSVPLEVELPKQHYTIPYEFGFSGSVESDRMFDTVDSTAGLSLRAYISNPVTDTLYRLFVPDINKSERSLAPCLNLGYKYVGHIKEGVDTGTGSQRLTADLYWSMPIARGWKVPEIIYKNSFDADFLIDIETVYDPVEGKFFNNSKLTLDFHSQVNPDKSPAFTLTYAQGKATPTFEHFDAFLAGLKIPF
jgi:hypothetical protein